MTDPLDPLESIRQQVEAELREDGYTFTKVEVSYDARAFRRVKRKTS